MTYKFNNPHDWLDFAVMEQEISAMELLSFIHKTVSSDDIQDVFQSEMDEDGYFDEDKS
jgi:hypothetical protein